MVTTAWLISIRKTDLFIQVYARSVFYIISVGFVLFFFSMTNYKKKKKNSDFTEFTLLTSESRKIYTEHPKLKVE